MAVLSAVEGPALYTTRFAVMGGPAIVRFVEDGGRARAERLARAAEDEAYRIERKYSRYREGSVVHAINVNAGRTPVAVDQETVGLVEAALELARMTNGRFDPTVGVLRHLWNFKEGIVPEPLAVDALLPLVDYEAVSVRDGTVFLRRAEMELDLGGVGKEYAVDRVAAFLRGEGIVSAIVNFAGDVRTVGGRGDGKPWSIGVVDPRDRARCRFSVRAVGDAGVATSGDYERAFFVGGVRYHHLLDATTGWPARGVASVTTVAASAAAAGRWATAAFLLGREEGLAALESAPGIEGAIIADDGTLAATSGMARVSDLPGSLYAEYRGI